MFLPKLIFLGLSLIVVLSIKAHALNCYTGVDSGAVSSSCDGTVCKNVTNGLTTYSCAASGSVGCNLNLTTGIKTCNCTTDLCNMGDRIKCYVGTGPNIEAEYCPIGTTQCTKTGIANLAVHEYGCGTTGKPEICLKFLGFLSCTCGEELCNSASKLGLSTFFALTFSMSVTRYLS